MCAMVDLVAENHENQKSTVDCSKTGCEANKLAREHLETANDLQYRSKKFSLAKFYYEQALENSSSLPPNEKAEIHKQFGILCENRLDLFKKARSHFEMALEIQPN